MNISIAGLIGSGKTSLATELSKLLGIHLYKEKVNDNKYLSLFYDDMKKYAFQTEIYTMFLRKLVRDTISADGNGSVVDRSIYEDRIFIDILYEDGSLTDMDYATLVEILDNTIENIEEPDIVIYLDVSPETAIRRIKKRGRLMEKDIATVYIEKLHKKYTDFQRYLISRVPVISVDWNTDHPDVSVPASELAILIKETFQ